MDPRQPRPDSAKTQQTRRTQDSQLSKLQLNSSKFSETFSSGGSSFHEKPDQFKKYVAEKERDPKFKHLKSKLEVVEEQGHQERDQKPSHKPFEKKRISERAGRKVEEQAPKPEEDLNLSTGFAQKNKQKMNSLKMAAQQKQTEEKVVNDKLKSRINFDSFKMTKPKEKKEAKKQTKIEVKKEVKKQPNSSRIKPISSPSPSKQPQKQQTVNQTPEKEKAIELSGRQAEMQDIERHIGDIEARNMASFPSQYDRMITSSPQTFEDIEMIDLGNFLQQPTEEGYERMMQNIEQFDKKIGNGIEEESIDLEEMISGDPEEEQTYGEKTKQTEEEDYLDEMSTDDLRKRNAFITDILEGKLSKKEIDELEDIQKSGIRMHKLDREKTQRDEYEEDGEPTEINMMKKQSHRVIEKNKVEAGGHIYRDCDYLSQEHQRRLEELLSGELEESPFDCNEMEFLRRRGIDEGIRTYRQLSHSVELGQILDPSILPKDPQSRNNAEKRILKEKIQSVNQRLGEIDRMEVTKEKIKAMLKQYEYPIYSQSYHQFSRENQVRYEENLQKLKEADQLLQHFEQKENLDDILDDIDSQYRELEQEIKTFAEMDAKELKRIEGERLKRKLREVEALQRENEESEDNIAKMEHIRDEAAESLKIYDGFDEVEFPEMHCEGYAFEETLEDIDSVITRKWQDISAQEASQFQHDQ